MASIDIQRRAGANYTVRSPALSGQPGSPHDLVPREPAHLELAVEVPHGDGHQLVVADLGARRRRQRRLRTHTRAMALGSNILLRFTLYGHPGKWFTNYKTIFYVSIVLLCIYRL